MDRTKYNYSSELEVELVKKNAVLCILVLFTLITNYLFGVSIKV